MQGLHVRQLAVIAIVASMVCGSVVAEQHPHTISLPEVLKRIDAAQARGNVLTALNELRTLQRDHSGQPDSDSYAAISTGLLALYPQVGLYEEALRVADFSKEGANALPDHALESLRAEKAIPSIIRAAHATRLIMINESHHVPRHRAFVTQLLASVFRRWQTSMPRRGARSRRRTGAVAALRRCLPTLRVSPRGFRYRAAPGQRGLAEFWLINGSE